MPWLSIPPEGRKGDVVLLSKFGMIGEFYLGRMVGGVFEGGDTPDFLRRDTLFLIREAPSCLCTVARTDTTKLYRYVRYFGPYKGYCNLAEVSQSDSLLYRDVPLDALMLLKNLTRGVDERVFEYKDGKQSFPNKEYEMYGA